MTIQSPVPDNRENFDEIFRLLQTEYPNAEPMLHFNNPLELLVATILSAQCTDKQVNKVTQVLFKKYHSVEDFANADLTELGKDIYTTGFYHQKAKHIIGSAQLILTEFGGKVPDNMEDLLKLPGVGRKTANIVLARGYDIIVGIAVDTHVTRLSQKLGFTKNSDPKKIEIDLMELAEKKDLENLSMTLILHGRNVCIARKPKCGACVVNELCPSSEV
ncbi:DNA-(apurinic or apyrimidinic site) lyase /endonuclease III [Methanolobus vulcani]|uniref:Endonuclease III n=1 Tax=Methanolobus vulcani TaxID=38026 RepID=A0A7Z7FFA4_9EURY|nr:endonuclease III [Methanolobus vulcani]SDG20527.1 DNA-(apurinic or apyrimidinic site) lyase /endonuclease III [Methanolobus vulcani]